MEYIAHFLPNISCSLFNAYSAIEDIHWKTYACILLV